MRLKILACFILLLALSLSACNTNQNDIPSESIADAELSSSTSTAPTVAPTETQTPTETELPPSESDVPSESTNLPPEGIVYDYRDTMGYQLTFPAFWEDHLSVQQNGNIVTATLDGNPIFSVASTANAPGVRRIAQDWEAQGYTFLAQTYDYVFYRKFERDIPAEFNTDSYFDVPNQSQTFYDFYSIFSCDTETELYRVNRDFALRFRQYLNTTRYENHLLGIAVQLPDGWEDYLQLTAWDNRLFLSMDVGDAMDSTFLVASVWAEEENVTEPMEGSSSRIPYLMGIRDGKYYYAYDYREVNSWSLYEEFMKEYPFLTELDTVIQEDLFVFLPES